MKKLKSIPIANKIATSATLFSKEITTSLSAMPISALHYKVIRFWLV